MYMLPMFADAKLIVYSDIFLFFNKINMLRNYCSYSAMRNQCTGFAPCFPPTVPLGVGSPSVGLRAGRNPALHINAGIILPSI